MATDPARAVKRTVKEARALQREQCRLEPCIPALRGIPICVICVNERLGDKNQPMGIAEYKLLESLPEPLQTNLPSIEQIERELQGGDA